MYNLDSIKNVMGPIVAELTPDTSDGDRIGHRDNFNALIEKINACPNVTAELLCYGCILTLPVQSELLFALDSSGYEVYRVLDIFTPDGDALSVRDVHEYPGPVMKHVNTHYSGCFEENPWLKQSSNEPLTDTVTYEIRNDTLFLDVIINYNCCGQLSDSLSITKEEVSLFLSDTCTGDNCICRCYCDFVFEYQFTGISQNNVDFSIYLKELNETVFHLWEKVKYTNEADQ